jgi:hypothetical protein
MRKSKEQIIEELHESFNWLYKTGCLVPEDGFNVSKGGKWTAAENIRHLCTGTKATTLAFTLPKFLLALVYGKPSHTSHSYSKLVDNYQKKLEAGAKATGAYVPEKMDFNKDKLLEKLRRGGEKLVAAITEKWTDEQLDHYQVKHPILGLLTLRELAYFTIYHNGHHLATIRKYYA